MSISAISPASSFVSPSNQNSTSIRQDFRQLSLSLQSNDLAGAQQSFSDLQRLLQSSQSASPSAVRTDLSNIGKALDSGDLKGAQAAFAQLQTDVTAASQGAQTQRAGHAHRHHHADADSNNGTAVNTNPVNTNGQISLLG